MLQTIFGTPHIFPLWTETIQVSKSSVKKPLSVLLHRINGIGQSTYIIYESIPFIKHLVKGIKLKSDKQGRMPADFSRIMIGRQLPTLPKTVADLKCDANQLISLVDFSLPVTTTIEGKTKEGYPVMISAPANQFFAKQESSYPKGKTIEVDTIAEYYKEIYFRIIETFTAKDLFIGNDTEDLPNDKYTAEEQLYLINNIINHKSKS